MPNILGVATSGLIAFQNAIAVTGNNISNVNTEGYSRQTINFETRVSSRFGTGYIGNGVDIGSINRINDELANIQYRTSTSLDSYLTEFYNMASQLDSLIAAEQTSVSNSIQSFYSALQNIVENPSNTPARQAFLTEAETMVNRFNVLDSQLFDIDQQVNVRLDGLVSQVNAIAEGIANLNQQISGNSNVSPQLLDQRDNLLVQLSELINTTVTEQTDGSYNVSIGNGQSLIIGSISTPLSTSRSPIDPALLDINLDGATSSTPITNSLSGGKIGALLSFREDVLDPAVNSLSRISLALADTFNSQHVLGMDATESIGINFFNDINTASAQADRVLANSNNSGTAVMSVAIDNVSNLTTSDYRLSVGAGPSYTLVRLSDNTSTNIGAFPATIDGFTLSLDSGAGVAGDSFIISPTRNAAASMTMNVTDPSQLALAAPIRTQPSTSNSGTGLISPGIITDTTTTAFTSSAKALSPPVRVEFLSATTYQLVNASTNAVMEGPIAYDPTATNNIFPTPGAYDPGYRVALSGVPHSGDTFIIEYNNGGFGDSRNAEILANTQTQKIIGNGTTNFQGAYGSILTDVGTKTNQANLNQQASSVLLSQAEARLQNLKGVNLDEEAANLLRYEQAYQAATQIINVANRLFDVLLSSFR